MARCLYAGLVTDTRNFRDAGPAAHRLAAELIEPGADPHSWCTPIMDTHPYPWLAVARPSCCSDAELDPAAARRARPGAHRRPRGRRRRGSGRRRSTASSTPCAPRPRPRSRPCSSRSGATRWTISLRSRGRVDVAAAAAALGGGGHPRRGRGDTGGHRGGGGRSPARRAVIGCGARLGVNGCAPGIQSRSRSHRGARAADRRPESRGGPVTSDEAYPAEREPGDGADEQARRATRVPRGRAAQPRHSRADGAQLARAGRGARVGRAAGGRAGRRRARAGHRRGDRRDRGAAGRRRAATWPSSWTRAWSAT